MKARGEIPLYIETYAAMVWREHAPAIRRAGHTGLRDWLGPIVALFALTESEAGALYTLLDGRLRDEAAPLMPPPQANPLFR